MHFALSSHKTLAFDETYRNLYIFYLLIFAECTYASAGNAKCLLCHINGHICSYPRTASCPMLLLNAFLRLKVAATQVHWPNLPPCFYAPLRCFSSRWIYTYIYIYIRMAICASAWCWAASAAPAEWTNQILITALRCCYFNSRIAQAEDRDCNCNSNSNMQHLLLHTGNTSLWAVCFRMELNALAHRCWPRDVFLAQPATAPTPTPASAPTSRPIPYPPHLLRCNGGAACILFAIIFVAQRNYSPGDAQGELILDILY